MTTTESPDFIASVTYLSPEKGGLKIPITSGYRAHIKFEFNAKQGMAEQIFNGEEMVYPGDTVEAAIKLITPELFSQTLTEGTSFDFTQSEKNVGSGVVKQILNKELRKN